MDIRSEVLNLVNDDEVRPSSYTRSPCREVEQKDLTFSGIPFGFGLLAIFQGSYQYLMDAYGPYAASAVCLLLHHPSVVGTSTNRQLASVTLTRYGISGLVILAYPTMYENLGSEWAGSYVSYIEIRVVVVADKKGYLLFLDWL
jgi:hypothetical protein